VNVDRMPFLIRATTKAYSFAVVGIHLCKNEHPATALTVHLGNSDGLAVPLAQLGIELVL